MPELRNATYIRPIIMIWMETYQLYLELNESSAEFDEPITVNMNIYCMLLKFRKIRNVRKWFNFYAKYLESS